MEMELAEKKTQLKELFRDDPLLERINSLDLTESFFEDGEFFNDLQWNYDYSTKQAAEILKVNRQQILNVLNRHDLKDYFQIFQSDNKYYSYNHVGLFQLMMVFFLLNNKHQPLDIANLIGTKLQISKGEKRPKNNNGHLPANNIDSTMVNRLVDEQLKQYSLLQKNYLDQEIKKMNEKNYEMISELQFKNNLLHYENNIRRVSHEIEILEIQENTIKMKPKGKTNFLAKLFVEDNREHENNMLKEIEEKKAKLLKEKNEIDNEKAQLIIENDKSKLLIAKKEQKDQLLKEIELQEVQKDNVNKDIETTSSNPLETANITDDK